MRLLIASEGRFEQGPDGGVYARGAETYAFWARYRLLFDEVRILARVRAGSREAAGGQRADGAGVDFAPLPDYCGPWEYLARLDRLCRAAREAVTAHAAGGGAFLLRAPGAVAYLAGEEIRRCGRAYGVEVLGDPWEALRNAPGSWSAVAPLARRWSRFHLAALCRGAAAACYVTRARLAARYPAPGGALVCSDVRLPALAPRTVLAARHQRLAAAAAGAGPWRLGFLGSLERLYKAPEVHLAAVARLLARGWNLEFSLAGEGRQRRKLERLAGELGFGGRLRFLGAIAPGASVEAYLDSLDVFLLASRTEGLPRALVEAMARGCPAIGSTAGGIPELLRPETLVEPGSAAALTARLETCLASPRQLSAMAERNYRAAGAYLEDRLSPVRCEFLWQLRNSST